MEKFNTGSIEYFSGKELFNRVHETYQKMAEVNNSVTDLLDNYKYSKTGKRLNDNLSAHFTQEGGNTFLKEFIQLGDVWRTLKHNVGYLQTLSESDENNKFSSTDAIALEEYYKELTQKVIDRLDKIKNEFEFERVNQK